PEARRIRSCASRRGKSCTATTTSTTSSVSGTASAAASVPLAWALGSLATLGFRAGVRAAAITLLEGYRTANSGSLKQIYPGRPLSIHPPCAFVDSISEGEVSYTPAGTQRTPEVAVRLVKGYFDSAEAVDGQDDFVDGFIEYVVDHRHAAGPNTLFLVES